VAGTAGSDRRIIELLEVEEPARDLDWLKKSLQTAVELELATIPVYLSGMWSIKAMRGEVFKLIKSVVMEEMLHLGLACNMLKALKVSPKLRDRVPDYPCPLPGGVGVLEGEHDPLTVYLAGLSKDSVKMYMDIERPEHPLGGRTGATHTIGEFYDAILQAFHSVNPALSEKGQQTLAHFFISVPKPSGDFSGLQEPLRVIATLDDVEKAITTIKDQGEGTSTTPEAMDFGLPELAHFYRFGEIFHGKRWNPADARFSGAPVLFPDPSELWPVAKVPKGGYPDRPEVQTQMRAFNDLFTEVLRGLEAAWGGEGDPAELPTATGPIDVMGKLAEKAQAVMKIPLHPDDPNSETFGPDFKVLPP
jgi:hypothetical protein